MKDNKLFKAAVYIAAAGVMTMLMVFNYTTNYFNKNNNDFAGFSAGSESLVTSGMIAEMRGLDDDFAMGYYETAFGNAKRSKRGLEYYNKVCAGITDDLFDRGYSRTQPGLVIMDFNVMANSVYGSGATIQFADGSIYDIKQVTVEGEKFYVQLDCDELLTEETKGVLLDAEVFDKNGDKIMLENYYSYISNYGLQGNIFSAFTKFLSPQKVFEFSNLFCSFCTALVFAEIVLLIFKKYNILMATCFYLVFLLAPVVVNFARNLYWVEFTWFVPMLIGLFCSVYYNSKMARTASCILMFCAVLLKSLCGYEYISTILVSAMAFLFADFVSACIAKDKKRAVGYFGTMSVMGVMAVAGFAVAIVMHATVRGDGNIMAGIVEIWQKDVMRRTLGGNPADFSEVFTASINASVTDVVKLYLNPKIEIIAGLGGGFFKIIMTLPVVAFAVDFVRSRKLDASDIVIWLITMVAALSWFVLAKSHSYEHTHLNIAMWYFGFVQMCLYIPLKTICSTIKAFAVGK